MEGVLCVAVESLLWVCNGEVSTVLEGHSLVKVWAVLQAFDVRADVLDDSLLLAHGLLIILSKLVSVVAVESNLWVWHSFGSTVGEGHSHIEVWALLEIVGGCAPVWILDGGSDPVWLLDGDSAGSGQEAGDGEEFHF